MKLLAIIGASPQFSKAATLSRIIRNRDDVEEGFFYTGQHFDDNMSSFFFQQMDIPEPDYNLDINNLKRGVMTSKMLPEIEEIILNENSGFDYSDHLVFSKGAAFQRMFGNWSYFLDVLYALKKHKDFSKKMSFLRFILTSFRGSRSYPILKRDNI